VKKNGEAIRYVDASTGWGYHGNRQPRRKSAKIGSQALGKTEQKEKKQSVDSRSGRNETAAGIDRQSDGM
jgi:hypothetical protein